MTYKKGNAYLFLSFLFWGLIIAMQINILIKFTSFSNMILTEKLSPNTINASIEDLSNTADHLVIAIIVIGILFAIISVLFFVSYLKVHKSEQLSENASLTDQLTGLPNRRSFDYRLSLEWKRAARDQTAISILIMDLDNFKKYNDSFGHQQGDKALKSFANTLNNALKRPGDFGARWGGEEFIALLSGTDAIGAMDLAEKIRQSVQDMDISAADIEATKITVSIGVNTWVYGDNSTLEEFISRADMALYNAKGSGRNKVCYGDKSP